MRRESTKEVVVDLPGMSRNGFMEEWYLSSLLTAEKVFTRWIGSGLLQAGGTT